ncbi:DUF92 domain-containing protein [Thermocladium modestius]|nr:DUF92 domain-containing protein [Thermocladium modestius]
MQYIAYYFAIGLAASIALALAAVKLRVIRRSAALAAVLIGTLISLSGPFTVAFFIIFLFLSTIVTRLGAGRKVELGVGSDLEGRTSRQVLAVGIVPGILSAAVALLPSRYLMDLLVIAVAASSADTWASEVGVLSRSRPRLITKPWIRLSPGTSGGVTALGELGSMMGSAAMVLAALALTAAAPLAGPAYAYTWLTAPPSDYPALWALGYVGEVLDSVLGALLQPKYFCPKCGVTTDQRIHHCGAETIKIRWGVVTNELVNLLATSAVLALAAVLIHPMPP